MMGVHSTAPTKGTHAEIYNSGSRLRTTVATIFHESSRNEITNQHIHGENPVRILPAPV